MSYGYKETLDSDAYSRYLHKLKIVDIKDCPYKFPADFWVNNPTKWPEVTRPDVYNYLTDTPGVYTKESMKNYRSLEAHNFLLSGWVQTVYHIQPEKSTQFVLKADAKPSWRMTDEPRHRWVAVPSEGRVIEAHCDCMAGLGESCSHVGALFFKIEAAVRNGYTWLACTEKPCEWNKCFVKSVTPAPVTSIQFYKDKSKNRLRESIRTRKPLPPTPLVSEQLGFLQSLESCLHKTIGLSTFKETAHHFASKRHTCVSKTLANALISLYDPSCINLTKEELVEKCKQILPTVLVSASENEYLKECTINQSNSLVWHEQRTSRITASVVYSVLHTNMECPAISIIHKICNPVQQELKSEPVQWGRLHEATAIKHYTAAIYTQHQDVKITRTGLGVWRKGLLVLLQMLYFHVHVVAMLCGDKMPVYIEGYQCR